MSSEMRESKFTNEDLETISRTWNSNKYTEHTAMLLASELLRARALLARTEAGADGAAAHIHDYGDRVRVVWDKPWADFPVGTRFYTHPQDASGDADVREFTRDDLPPATHATFIAPRGSVWCWVGHEVIDIVNKHVAAMQAKEAK